MAESQCLGRNPVVLLPRRFGPTRKWHGSTWVNQLSSRGMYMAGRWLISTWRCGRARASFMKFSYARSVVRAYWAWYICNAHMRHRQSSDFATIQNNEYAETNVVFWKWIIFIVPFHSATTLIAHFQTLCCTVSVVVGRRNMFPVLHCIWVRSCANCFLKLESWSDEHFVMHACNV